MSEKPKVLILGGTGFVARHLVQYLIDNNLASKIRVADKQLPVTAYMTEHFKKYYSNPIVEFKQANLSNPDHIKRAFADDTGKFQFVINLAAETRYGLEESVYKQMIYTVSVECAKFASAYGVDKYIEFSTAQIYEPSKKPSKEEGKTKPWTKLAKFKLEAEEEVRKLDTLPWIIVRPAIIYGPGDLNGLIPRIVCAATYTHSKDKMKLLWSGDLRINTVHVTDVARATWHLLQSGKPHSTYNLADKTDLSQEDLGNIFSTIFGVETSFYGTVISNLAKLNMKNAVETANDTHMDPWNEMLRESGIKSTPLSPYIHQELLYNTSLYVDGSAIEETTGFKYDKPKVTAELIQAEIDYWKELNLFPAYSKLK